MGAWRRHQREGEWERARRGRGDLDLSALEAAAQTLLDTWPWLVDQYRRANVTGESVDLPIEPIAAAIRRYLEHAGP